MRDDRQRDTSQDLLPAGEESWDRLWTAATRIDIKPAPPVRPESVELDDDTDLTLPDVPALDDTHSLHI